MPVDDAGGHLSVGIEKAQRFEIIAEEVEPQAGIEPAGKQVEDRAANRELAVIDHGIGAVVTLALQQAEAVLSSRHASLLQAQREQHELAILEEFMPEPLDEEELERIVDDAIAEVKATSMRDMGRVMADVMPQIAGRADGSAVSQLVREKLA